MDNTLLWQTCHFRDDGLLDRPNIHDAFVYALAVHLEHRLLLLRMDYRDRGPPSELTDVRFSGLVAHYFQDVVAPSILLDIEEVALGWVVQEWRAVFERGQHYNWPFPYAHAGELVPKLEKRGVRAFRVMGSSGLDGFILATLAEYRQPGFATQLASVGEKVQNRASQGGRFPSFARAAPPSGAHRELRYKARQPPSAADFF